MGGRRDVLSTMEAATAHSAWRIRDSGRRTPARKPGETALLSLMGSRRRFSPSAASLGV